MAKTGKRMKAAKESYDATARFQLLEAVKIIKEAPATKFDESVDIAMRLGVNPTKADQMIRGSVALPKGTGKKQRIAVFAKGDKAREAEEAGADFVGAEDLVTKVEGGWMDFDVAVSTPDMMGQVGKLGKVLGPRGLMPNPKSGTVTFEMEKVVNEIQAGKVEFRVDKAGIVHAPVGKASFSVEDIFENAKMVIEQTQKMKPATVKGTYIRSISISTTMGPGVRIDNSNIGLNA